MTRMVKMVEIKVELEWEQVNKQTIRTTRCFWPKVLTFRARNPHQEVFWLRDYCIAWIIRVLLVGHGSK